MLFVLVLLLAQGVSDGQGIPTVQPAAPVSAAMLVRPGAGSLPAAPSSSLNTSTGDTVPLPMTPPVPAITAVASPQVRRSAQIPGKKAWVGLTIALHSSAAFDAWTTRRRVATGLYHESNPVLKPFASNNSLYAVTQITPVVLDVLGNRLRNSKHGWMRRVWWVPQTAQATTHLVCGAGNLTK